MTSSDAITPQDSIAPIVSCLSFAHPHVPAKDRDRLAIAESDLTSALADIVDPPQELVVISTCLRHELVAVGDVRGDRGVPGLQRLAIQMSHQSVLPKAAQFHYGLDVFHHVFRVTAGLCSPVIGEAEILGQIRRAHTAARTAGTLGPVLDQLFREAINTARAAHELLPEPDKGSIASLAADYIHGLDPGRVTIIGGGQMANSVNDRLESTDWQIVRVARRPELVPGASGFDQLEDALTDSTVLVTAVSSPEPILNHENFAHLTSDAIDRLTIIDLGMPANVSRDLPTSIKILNIDDLAHDGSYTISTEAAENLIEMRAIEAHARAMNSALTPLIRALRDKAEQAAQEELDQAFARLKNLDDNDRAVVTQLARTLTNRLLHDPLLYLSSHPEAIASSQTAQAILGIDCVGTSTSNDVSRKSRSNA